MAGPRSKIVLIVIAIVLVSYCRRNDEKVKKNSTLEQAMKAQKLYPFFNLGAG